MALWTSSVFLHTDTDSAGRLGSCLFLLSHEHGAADGWTAMLSFREARGGLDHNWLYKLVNSYIEKGLEEALPYCAHSVQQASSVSHVVVKYTLNYFCRYLSVQSSWNYFQILSQLSRIVVMASWQRHVLLGNSLGWKRSQGSLSLFWKLHKKEEARPDVVSSLVFGGSLTGSKLCLAAH